MTSHSAKQFELNDLAEKLPMSSWGASSAFTCAADEPVEGFRRGAPRQIRSAEWQEQLQVAARRFVDQLETNLRQFERVQTIEREVAALNNAVQILRNEVCKLRDANSIVAQITTLEPKPFVVLNPISVVLQEVDTNSAIASFFDANINASGHSIPDAYEALKDAIVSTYKAYTRHEAELGSEPRRQLAVIRKFIREAS